MSMLAEEAVDYPFGKGVQPSLAVELLLDLRGRFHPATTLAQAVDEAPVSGEAAVVLRQHAEVIGDALVAGDPNQRGHRRLREVWLGSRGPAPKRLGVGLDVAEASTDLAIGGAAEDGLDCVRERFVVENPAVEEA